MKKSLLWSGVLLLIACTTKAPQYPWANLTFPDAQAAAGEKLIMLDFYTEW